MQYLFLDIDGPLNTGRNDFLDPDRYGHHFDDVVVRNLRRIVEETGARIVVSSSWRQDASVNASAMKRKTVDQHPLTLPGRGSYNYSLPVLDR